MFFLARKNQSGTNVKDCIDSWNIEQASLHADLLGRWQNGGNSKTGANTGLIQNETILTQLAPFTNPATIAIASGQVPKPALFAYTLDLRINGKKVFPITHDQIDSVNDSVIDPPSVTDSKYYYTEYLSYYYLLPQSVTGNADLDYIANCADIFWAYTLDGNNRQVYNPSGITGTNVIYGGAGYTTPTIAFSAPAAGGVQATGTLSVFFGAIVGVVMTNPGQGYAGLTPTYTITGGSSATAILATPTVSVQPQWLQNEIVLITKRALTNLGISFRDNDFLNAGRVAQKSGV